jgi:hypothetical protein
MDVQISYMGEFDELLGDGLRLHRAALRLTMVEYPRRAVKYFADAMPRELRRDTQVIFVGDL